MCGIFGYIRQKDVILSDPVPLCINGLKRLEYRGYDSAGIAGIEKGKIRTFKTVGKVSTLEETLKKETLNFDIAIAHTRWATHGKLTEKNAHPHTDEHHTLAIAHNGIIENYMEIKQSLLDENFQFISDTDSEVIAHLIAKYYDGDLLEAVCKALPSFKGAFAFALIHKDHPTSLIGATRNCPLVIGRSKTTGELFLSSDVHACGQPDLEVIYLEDDEIVQINPDEVSLYNAKGIPFSRAFNTLPLNTSLSSKNGFDHYMLKEIHEQPSAFKQSINSRYEYEYGTATFPELNTSSIDLLSVKQILILGCGTSWHAGCIAAAMIENLARIPAKCEIASEFRYTDPIISENTLVIAISQSGETADTIAAVKEAKAKGAHILAICNVERSKITREADATIFIKAGPEISVCSTKAFTCQLAVLSLFSLYLARLHHMNKEDGKKFLDQIKKMPLVIEQVLRKEKEIEKLAEKYSIYEHFFFLGRRYMYHASLEAALKLKEISYINACGYPAGEMKHGPIALVNKDLPIVAMCGNEQTLDKMISNMKEIEARHGPILAFVPQHAKHIEDIATDVLYLPSDVIDALACIPYCIAAQLFSYYVAKIKKTDIDQPRNLAKSVTVE
ncbi:MAG: glutamine--fructose-6-phosphate transaminase (isomerizing) [Chlamydiales bacterium]|nr:glutamine--fructose-6-phosphate transaminase (isomerizing) [Chlamydiales bacterium]